MNGALWVTQTCLVVPRYSHHAATRREREHQSPRFTFDPPRSSQVQGRRPRISRDLSDRATIVSRGRSEEHTSELQSLMSISYDVYCLKKKKRGINPLGQQVPDRDS